MSGKIQQGFTIIEVMLVLAISGLLMVALMAGWTTMLNTQSYQDSARTLVSSMQRVYTNTYNVENNRADKISCTSAGAGSNTVRVVEGSDIRGASDCIVMGKYVVFNQGEFTIYPVVGIEPDTPVGDKSDTETITDYLPTLFDEGTLSDNISWSAKPYLDKGQKSEPFYYALLMLRTPTNGTVHTFSGTLNQSQATSLPESAPSPQEIILRENSESEVVICLDPGATVASSALGVQVSANAADISAVRMLSVEQGSEC